MKRIVILLLVAVTAGAFLPACGKLNNDKAKVSYAIGQQIGTGLQQIKDEIDLSAVKQGLDDAVNGREPKLGMEEARQVLQDFQRNMMSRRPGMDPASADRNAKEGAAFLAENAKKPGVKTTASGLQYKVIKQGSGPKPKATDKVKVDYKGTLIDGKEFDSSYRRGMPAVFPVSGVIKGWIEGLQLMPVGSKYQLFIPSNLAYGETGQGQDIGPNSTLVFEVELHGIEK